MGKSAVLARLVAVCAVTALAGSALAVAPANADTPAAPAPSVATPDSAASGIRRKSRATGSLRIKIVGVPYWWGTVRVTGNGYSKVINSSTKLRVPQGRYLVTSRRVAATGGTYVPKAATQKLLVRKNKLTGFTVRYRFVPSGRTSCATGGGAANTCALGNTGPGGGKVFYVNNAAATGSRYMEAVVAGMTPAWDDNNGGLRYPWCVGFGKMNNVITGTAIGAYLVNTNNMVAACTYGAANSVRAYTGGGLPAGSWSLPSLNELNALDISGVGGLWANMPYWSSTQHNVASTQNDVPWAWSQNVGYGGGSAHQGFGSKDSDLFVRPVRAF